MDKQKAEKFAQFLVKKYGLDGAKKKIEKIQKTGKIDEEDVKDFLKSEQLESLAKAKKALHGTKLSYLKQLKHLCNDGEELFYYKKGGSLGCGCKKKEEGGEIKKASNGAVEKFRNARKAGFGDKLLHFANIISDGGFREALKKKEEKKKPKTVTFQGKPQMIVGKDLPRGTGNDTSEQEKKDPSARDYYRGRSYSKKY